jgi:hypothetical protein
MNDIHSINDTNDMTAVEEDAEEIFRRTADAIAAKKKELTSSVDREQIKQCMKKAANMALIARRELADIKKHETVAIEAFLSRYVVSTPVPVSASTALPNALVPAARGRPCRFNASKPIVRFAELLAEYNTYAIAHQLPPVNQLVFSRMMSERKYVTERVRGKECYVGIRLRTVDDPIPRFPDECSVPDYVEKLDLAFVFGRGPNYPSSDIGKKINEWVFKYYDAGNAYYYAVETKEIYQQFRKETAMEVSKEMFDESLNTFIFYSYPTEYRWCFTAETKREDLFTPEMEKVKGVWASLIRKK